MFQSLMKPFRRNNSQDAADGQTTVPTRNDRTDDGFLLVGQTASERTTVYANEFRSDQVNPPPEYSQSHGGLPTYTDYNANRFMYNPTLNVSQNPLQHPEHFNTASPTIPTRTTSDYPGQENTDSVKSPITDIPFVMSGQLRNQKLINDLKFCTYLDERSFNLCNYEYDFRLEMSVLHEHDNIMDEA